MTEATLLTRSMNARSVLTLPPHMGETSFDLRVVYGIELPSSPTILHRDVRRDNVQEEALEIPDNKAERLAEFMLRKIIDPSPGFRNCLTFAGFMHSGQPLNELNTSHNRLNITHAHEVAPDMLAAGESYVAYLADQKSIVHGVVGTNNPAEHIAVWGNSTSTESNLAIASNRAMLDVYDAAHILKVNGEFQFTPLESSDSTNL